MKICILYGGFDKEIIASLGAIESVYKSLSINNWVEQMYVDKNNLINFSELDYDFIFVLIHGKYSEEGLLSIELINKKHNLASFKSCQKCYNKYNSKTFLSPFLLVTPFCLYENQDYEFFQSLFGNKIVIKPIKGGSSVDVFICSNKNDFNTIPKIYGKTMIEKYICGSEYQVAIIKYNNKFLIEIGKILSNFYTMDQKYGNTKYYTTISNLDQKIENKLKKLATHIFNLCELTKFARIDFFINQNNDIYFNEINTLPGLGENSIFVKLFEKQGYNQQTLLELLLKIEN